MWPKTVLCFGQNFKKFLALDTISPHIFIENTLDQLPQRRLTRRLVPALFLVFSFEKKADCMLIHFNMEFFYITCFWQILLKIVALLPKGASSFIVIFSFAEGVLHFFVLRVSVLFFDG